MGNALLIQFPDVRFERTLIPFISSVEEAREVVARLDAVLDRAPGTPLVFATAASDEVRLELLKTRCPVIDFFEPAHAAGGVDPARPRRARGRPTARRRRHQALQQPDAGGGVHHRARRRPERARPGEGRRDPGGALALRQDADGDVPRAAARPVRGQLPDRRRGPREQRAPPTGARPAREVLRADDHAARLAAVRQERRPDSRYASLDQCTFELRRTEAIFKPLRAAGHRLLDQVRGGDLDDHPAEPEDPRSTEHPHSRSRR